MPNAAPPAARVTAAPLRGLDPAEAAARLVRVGPNEIAEVKPRAVLLFLRRFWGLTAWMLELTLALALLRGRPLDAGIVGALLWMNAILGFAQEQRASRALEALRRRLRVNVKTLRGGVWTLVDASGLVPGDVVRVRQGDFVPADLELLAGGIEADLSALTGESEARPVGVGEALPLGAVVRRGEGTARVVETGARTLYGRTAQWVQLARPKLHFEAVLRRVVRWLLIMVGALLGVTVALWWIRGGDLGEVLPLMLILLVSAIPVALPAMFTVTLALGSLELARHGALVTRLSAPEDAARMDVLCSDKTGTLTANRPSLAAVVGLGGHAEDEVLAAARDCSQEANDDPIDRALLESARARGLGAGGRVIAFAPFEARTRRTEAVVERDGRPVRVMKGALETVLAACTASADEVPEARAWATQAASRGERCLAVASEADGALRLLGLVALADRPRADARATVAALRELGVEVKMLTGDAVAVADQVARELGWTRGVVRSGDLGDDPAARLDATDGVAEIYPEDKYRIVRALQERGHVVGMTGDGVNDAPALKQAEVGVAMANATDVAKAAASVVLTAEGLSAVPELVRIGRSIHQRLETWILNKIVKTFQTVAFVVVAFLVTGRFVVSTFDMVLLLFLVDFVTLALATDVARGAGRPVAWDIDHLVGVGLRIGVLCVVESLGLLWAGWRLFDLAGDLERLHSFGFAVLFFFGVATVLVVRERGPFWTSRPSRPLAVALVVDALVVAVLVTRGAPGLAPLPWTATLLIVATALVFGVVVNDAIKRRAGE